MRFNSPYGIVTLTDERKAHIFTFHPDVARCLPYFADTLAKPGITIISANDSTVIICYHFLSRRKKYLAIVVKLTEHPFVLTAYLAKKPKQGILYP
ncbi:MAG: hypothetical protein AAB794_04310 [Patescibacteria group bacterium]